MRSFIRTAVVLYLAVWLAAGTPAFAQAQQSQTQSQESTSAQGAPAANYPSLLKGPDYSKGPRTFPNLFNPYFPIFVPKPDLTNSKTIYSMIHDGKLELSIDDAVALALQNNLDIAVQRFQPWFAQTDLLNTEGGGTPIAQFVTGGGGGGTFDPVVFSTLSVADSTSPVNNSFTSGVGTIIPSIQSHTSQFNFGYSQEFHEGTSVTAQWTNTRSSVNFTSDLYNPSVQSTFSLGISQPLLRGFGFLPTTRFILEAKNENKQYALTFEEQVITSVTAVENQYWSLVYARENVRVQKAALASDQKLYEDNKRQLEIGTLAPLDVLTAESAVATDQQNVIVAQTNELQQETVLLNLITKNPLDAAFQGVEIDPTTPITQLPEVPNITFGDAVKEAWANRPELKADELGLNTAGIEIKATRNGLLPSLSLSGQVSSTGLNGLASTITETPTAFAPDPSQPIINNGAPIPNEFVGVPIAFNTAVTTVPGGLGDSLDQAIHGRYPTYAASLSLSLPIRNRSAQAANARAQLNDRQLQTSFRRDQNSILVSVRNALIAIQQGAAQVAAAEKATQLAQETLTDEQKKYQLGASNSYNVVLRTRDLTAAEGNELQAKVNLEIAMVTFNQAMGRTLSSNHIMIANAKSPSTFDFSAPLIPGTINGRLANDTVGLQK